MWISDLIVKLSSLLNIIGFVFFFNIVLDVVTNVMRYKTNKDYHDVFLGHVLFLGNLRKAQLKFVEAYVRLILYKYEITT